MSAARDAVRALMGAGLTQRQIAATIGVDKSYISQIHRGATPGDKRAGELSALAAGQVVKPAPNRVTGQAPSASYVRGGDVVVAHRAGAGVRRTLSNVSRASGRVRVVVRGQNSDGSPFVATPWGERGISAAYLRELVDGQLDSSSPSAEDTTAALARVLADAPSGHVDTTLPEQVLIQSVSIQSIGG